MLKANRNTSCRDEIKCKQHTNKVFSFQVVVMAPIFGFFGKVDTKVWYSLILLLLLVAHVCVGAHVFKVLETGFYLSLCIN